MADEFDFQHYKIQVGPLQNSVLVPLNSPVDTLRTRILSNSVNHQALIIGAPPGPLTPHDRDLSYSVELIDSTTARINMCSGQLASGNCWIDSTTQGVGSTIQVGDQFSFLGLVYENQFSTTLAAGSFTIAGGNLTSTGTTATCQTTGNHGLATGAIVTVTGANESEYNVSGASVTVTSADTFTYEMAGDPADTATTGGTLQVAYSGGNVFLKSVRGGDAYNIGSSFSLSPVGLGLGINNAVVDQDGMTGGVDKQFSTIVSFSTMEYTGEAGGDNEFQVVYRGSFTPTTASPLVYEQSLVTDLGLDSALYARASASITGTTVVESISNSGSLDLNRQMAVAIYDRELGTPDDDQRISFSSGAGALPTTEFDVKYEIIDWVGSNWQVERPNTGSGRSDQEFVELGASVFSDTIDITAIPSWDNAWIEASMGSNASDTGMSSGIVTPGSSTALVDVVAPTVLGGTHQVVLPFGFFVIYNPFFKVHHQGEDFGNTAIADRLNEELMNTVTLQTSSNVDGNLDEMFALLDGFYKSSSSSSATANYTAGVNNTTIELLSATQVKLEHSIDSLFLSEHVQVIQASDQIQSTPDLTKIQTVTYLPRFDLEFVKRD